MKIIIIGPFPVDITRIRGGVESSVFGLARELAKTDNVVVMDVPRMQMNDGEEQYGNLRIFRYRNRGSHQVDARQRISDVILTILKEHPAICHIHGTEVFSWRIFEALQRKHIPTIVTVHGLVGVEKKKELKRAFSMKKVWQLLVKGHAERRLLNAVGSVIVDTAYVAEAIDAYRLKNAPHCYVIPQGINDHYYGLSCSTTSHEILSVGAISRRKGHLLLLQSFEAICERIPDARLTICGHMADPSYYSEIIDYLAGSHLKERVDIITDANQELLDNLYRRAHVFALQSQEESQGIALVEAMAVGLPVVATLVGGIPHVVEHGKTGLLTPYLDVISFAESLLSLFGNDIAWKDMSYQCQQEARRYSWAQISEQVQPVYQQCIQKSNI